MQGSRREDEKLSDEEAPCQRQHSAPSRSEGINEFMSAMNFATGLTASGADDFFFEIADAGFEVIVLHVAKLRFN